MVHCWDNSQLDFLGLLVVNVKGVGQLIGQLFTADHDVPGQNRHPFRDDIDVHFRSTNIHQCHVILWAGGGFPNVFQGKAININQYGFKLESLEHIQIVVDNLLLCGHQHHVVSV